MTSMRTTTATQSATMAAIYNDAVSRVGTLLGKNFKIVAPVTNYVPSTSNAEVSISAILAAFLNG